jgi:hypothetical protein
VYVITTGGAASWAASLLVLHAARATIPVTMAAAHTVGFTIRGPSVAVD